MTRALAIALLLAACGSSHEPADGGPRDAGAELDAGPPPIADAGPPDSPPDPDAGPPDGGPPCPDADGDGYADAACGGDDCDDTDPALSPAASFCEAPDITVRCATGFAERHLCADPEPACDARTGACAPTACGDGVLHSNEQCDDGNTTDGDGCDASCAWEPCTRDADCPAALPSCSDYRPDGTAYCRALVPGGAANGELCATDADCASGWCDDDQLRCTVRCVDDSDCPGATSFCKSWWGAPPACRRACFRHADCPGRGCVFTTPFWTCSNIAGPGDVLEPCDGYWDCRSNSCSRPYCTGHCIDDSDCPAPWVCQRQLRWAYPAGSPLPFAQICGGPFP